MGAAQRIVSLLPSATEILYGIGLGPRVVAVSHECDYPPEVARKPRVTVSYVDAAAASGAIDCEVRERAAAGMPLYGVDEEALTRLRPDLIVTQSQCDVCAVNFEQVAKLAERIGSRGVPTVALDPSSIAHRPSPIKVPVVALNPTSLEGVLADILRVGQAAGASTEAERFVAALSRRIEIIRRATGSMPAAERPRVAVIEWIEPLMLAANWTPQLVALAGGDCGLVEAGVHSTYASWEELRQYNPQVIVVTPCGFNLDRTCAEAGRLESLAGWSEQSAVRNGRVYAVDGNAFFNRPGPRLVDSLELLAHLIHPERVGPPPVCEPAAWCRL